MSGDREAALATYRRMKSVDDRDRASETYMYRIARRRMKEPITPAEALLIRGGNDLARKAYDSAASLYRRVMDSSGTDVDLRARALLGLQQVALAKEDYAAALTTGEELTALRPPTERWTVPQGLLQLGGTLEKLGRTAEARSAYEKVFEYDDYDFQKSVEEKARRELSRLKTAG